MDVVMVLLSDSEIYYQKNDLFQTSVLPYVC